jgi:hypothetical protein
MSFNMKCSVCNQLFVFHQHQTYFFSSLNYDPTFEKMFILRQSRKTSFFLSFLDRLLFPLQTNTLKQKRRQKPWVWAIMLNGKMLTKFASDNNVDIFGGLVEEGPQGLGQGRGRVFYDTLVLLRFLTIFFRLVG